MKHAILILAHKDIGYLCRLVESFPIGIFRLYIHVDRRCGLTDIQVGCIRQAADVRYLGQEYSANWGSYALVRATILLCRKALADEDNEYFHLISGSDIRTCTCEHFYDFFKKNKGRNFIMNFDFFSTSQVEKRRNRLVYEHRLEQYNIRDSKNDNDAYQRDLKNQVKNRKVKPLPDFPVFHGSQWWSLERACIRYIVGKESFIEKNFKLVSIPDEIFAQTVIMNSPFSQSVVNCNMRYILWEFRNGNSPAVLDRSDLPVLLSGDYLFARKVELPVSNDLITSVYNIFNIQDNMEFKIMSFDDIISFLRDSVCEECHNGLYYGTPGVLLFCVYGSEVYVEKSERLWHMAVELIPYVVKELSAAYEDSYKTGRLGIAACLECLYPMIGSMIGDDILCVLDEIHSRIVNRICNSSRDEANKEELAEFRSYISSCIYGGRNKEMDMSIWNNFFTDDDKRLNKRAFLWNRTVGLAGFSGRGLEMLTERHGLDYNRWQFLML